MDIRSENYHPMDESKTKNSKLWEYHACDDLGSVMVNAMHTKEKVISLLEKDNTDIFQKYNPVSLKVYDEVVESFEMAIDRWRTAYALGL